jgi:hypothetical protein
MAGKSFLTLEEAAARLGKSSSEVTALADKGLLQRVMHEGQAKFRVEQVELLAGNDDGGELRLGDDIGPIGLADSAGGSAAASRPGFKSPSPLEDSVLGLADSSAGSRGPADSSERTGISALTGRGKGGDAVEIGLETVGSGSGLLDLTRESEETALGAELIDQVYSNEGDGSVAGASGLFDATGGDVATPAASPVIAGGMMMPEQVDGAWSGVGVGLMIAAIVGLVVAGLIAVSAVAGSGSAVASSFAGNLAMWGGSLAGIAAVFGLVGFFVGRASE